MNRSYLGKDLEQKSIVVFGFARPEQHKSLFWSDVETVRIVDCQSALSETTINHSPQGATSKSWMMDWVKGAVVGFCFI